MSSGKGQPFRLGLNVLKNNISSYMVNRNALYLPVSEIKKSKSDFVNENMYIFISSFCILFFFKSRK